MKLKSKLLLISIFTFAFLSVKSQINELFVNNALGKCSYDLKIMVVPYVTSCFPIEIPLLAYTIAPEEEKTFKLTQLIRLLGSGYRYAGLKVVTPNKTLYVYKDFCGAKYYDCDPTGDCGGDLVEVYMSINDSGLASIDITDQQ